MINKCGSIGTVFIRAVVAQQAVTWDGRKDKVTCRGRFASKKNTKPQPNDWYPGTGVFGKMKMKQTVVQNTAQWCQMNFDILGISNG